MDEQKLNRLVQALYDASNRGLVAGTVGAPVDMSNALLSILGLGSAKPVMGSDWLGDQMEKYKMVSPNRYPMAENLMMSLGLPAGSRYK